VGVFGWETPESPYLAALDLTAALIFVVRVSELCQTGTQQKITRIQQKYGSCLVCGEAKE
jgi:hypothetical protein